MKPFLQNRSRALKKIALRTFVQCTHLSSCLLTVCTECSFPPSLPEWYIRIAMQLHYTCIRCSLVYKLCIAQQSYLLILYLSLTWQHHEHKRERLIVNKYRIHLPETEAGIFTSTVFYSMYFRTWFMYAFKSFIRSQSYYPAFEFTCLPFSIQHCYVRSSCSK